ncbi:MAG: endonuclease/exonuclease/phosphatase family protein [Casimicrobiaceae bacterium]
MSTNASRSLPRLLRCGWWTLAAATPLLTGCFTLTELPRALVIQADGAITLSPTTCRQAMAQAKQSVPAPRAPTRMRIMSWNIHKESDDGWKNELARLGRDSDILALQEVTLVLPVLDVLQRSDFRWVMASSFAYDDYDVGVLTATHIAPIASCTQRAVEPLLRLPKSALISWFATRGKPTLAVANVHAINFTLSTDEFQAQLSAVADILGAHDGPIVLAGDFNTWSLARKRTLDQIARRLGLEEVAFADDERTRFFGKPLDHILTRGLRVIASEVITVTSSDHNPLFATLEIVE